MKTFQLLFITLLAMLFSPMSMAALPVVIGTTLTAIQADALALVDLVWPVVGAIVGAFLLFKLFKRGAAKV